jgi:hypothetical protein
MSDSSSDENVFDSDLLGDVENLSMGESDEINLSDVGAVDDNPNEVGDAQVIRWDDGPEDLSGDVNLDLNDIDISEDDSADVSASAIDDSDDFVAASVIDDSDDSGVNINPADDRTVASSLNELAELSGIFPNKVEDDVLRDVGDNALSDFDDLGEGADSISGDKLDGVGVEEEVAAIEEPERIAVNNDDVDNVADITEPVPTKRTPASEPRRQPSRQPSGQSRSLGQMLTIPLVLAVIGGLGYGGFTMISGNDKPAQLAEKPLEGFDEMPAEAKADNLAGISAALDQSEQVDATKIKDIEAKIETIGDQKHGEDVDIEVRLLKSMLKRRQKSQTPANDANTPDNTSAQLDRQFEMDPAMRLPIVWMTAAIIGYQELAPAQDDSAKKIEQFRKDATAMFKAGRFSAAAYFYLDLAEAEVAAGLLDKGLGHLNVAEVTLSDARRANKLSPAASLELMASIDDIRIRVWAAKRKQGDSSATEAANKVVQSFRTENNRTIANLKTQVATDIKSATDTATAAQTAVAKLTAPDGELAGLKTAATSNAAASKAAADAAKLNSDALTAVQGTVKTASDSLKTAQDGLATVSTDLKTAIDNITAQVTREQAMATVLKAGIKESLAGRLSERMAAVEPKAAADASDAQKQAVAQAHASWKIAADSVASLKAQLAAVDQKSNSQLLSDLVKLQQAEQQLQGWESQTLVASSISKIPIPGPQELANTVVTILKDQINEGVLTKVKQLNDLEIPADVIGRAGTRKVIQEVLSEFKSGTSGVTVADLAKLKLNLEDSLNKSADTTADKALASARKELDAAKKAIAIDIDDVKTSVSGVNSSVASLATAEEKKRAVLAQSIMNQLNAKSASIKSDVEKVATSVQTTEQNLQTTLASTRDELEKQIEVARTATRPIPANQMQQLSGNVSEEVFKVLASWGYIPLTGPDDQPAEKADVELARQLFQDGYDEYYAKNGSDSAARRLFVKSVQLEPNNPVYRYYLGLSMHSVGESVEGAKQVRLGAKFERALDLSGHVAERLERVQFSDRKWLNRVRVESLTQ